MQTAAIIEGFVQRHRQQLQQAHLRPLCVQHMHLLMRSRMISPMHAMHCLHVLNGTTVRVPRTAYPPAAVASAPAAAEPLAAAAAEPPARAADSVAAGTCNAAQAAPAAPEVHGVRTSVPCNNNVRPEADATGVLVPTQAGGVPPSGKAVEPAPQTPPGAAVGASPRGPATGGDGDTSPDSVRIVAEEPAGAGAAHDKGGTGSDGNTEVEFVRESPPLADGGTGSAAVGGGGGDSAAGAGDTCEVAVGTVGTGTRAPVGAVGTAAAAARAEKGSSAGVKAGVGPRNGHTTVSGDAKRRPAPGRESTGEVPVASGQPALDGGGVDRKEGSRPSFKAAQTPARRGGGALKAEPSAGQKRQRCELPDTTGAPSAKASRPTRAPPRAPAPPSELGAAARAGAAAGQPARARSSGSVQAAAASGTGAARAGRSADVSRPAGSGGAAASRASSGTAKSAPLLPAPRPKKGRPPSAVPPPAQGPSARHDQPGRPQVAPGGPGSGRPKAGGVSHVGGNVGAKMQAVPGDVRNPKSKGATTSNGSLARTPADTPAVERSRDPGSCSAPATTPSAATASRKRSVPGTRPVNSGRAAGDTAAVKERSASRNADAARRGRVHGSRDSAARTAPAACNGTAGEGRPGGRASVRADGTGPVAKTASVKGGLKVKGISALIEKVWSRGVSASAPAAGGSSGAPVDPRRSPADPAPDAVDERSEQPTAACGSSRSTRTGRGCAALPDAAGV